ncbi:DUF2845 domain-containing protein [Thalassotalea euphylliae]|uniref:DUF2845 domain-containing protein n=1 Tax=Thalassotalea euphylliae TaxID=1655234 RepID=UPI0036403AE1
MMKYTLVTLCVLALWTESIAAAERERATIRCKGGHVRGGMEKFKVMSICGTPLDSDVVSGADQVKVEKLLYKLKKSPSAPLIIFTFKGGRLFSIVESS